MHKPKWIDFIVNYARIRYKRTKTNASREKNLYGRIIPDLDR